MSGAAPLAAIQSRQCRWLLSAALLAITVALCKPGLAAELAQPAGLVREAVVIPFTQSDGKALALQGVLVRPPAPGRYPLALINHGTASTPDQSRNAGAGHTAGAIEFARRGWAVGLVARRSYGGS